MKQLKWTADAPCIDGWYWYRDSFSDPEVVRVEHTGDTFYLWRTGDDQEWHVESYGKSTPGEWLGPIEPLATGPVVETKDCWVVRKLEEVV